MMFKYFLSVVFTLFTCLLTNAQNPENINVKVDNLEATHFTIQFTVADVNYEVDNNGTVVNAFRKVKNFPDQEYKGISFWQSGWGNKEGKIKSIDNVDLDYWSDGWGNEKSGKIKSIGTISFDYWAPGWGKEKEGKIKSVGNINFDYWETGWGNEKEGKVKLIGSTNFDYWSAGWGEKEGKIKSIKDKGSNVEIIVPFI